MDTCIYCHADSIFTVCDDCEVTTTFRNVVDISDSAPVRPTRTRSWFAPVTYARHAR